MMLSHPRFRPHYTNIVQHMLTYRQFLLLLLLTNRCKVAFGHHTCRASNVFAQIKHIEYDAEMLFVLTKKKNKICTHIVWEGCYILYIYIYWYAISQICRWNLWHIFCFFLFQSFLTYYLFFVYLSHSFAFYRINSECMYKTVFCLIFFLLMWWNLFVCFCFKSVLFLTKSTSFTLLGKVGTPVCTIGNIHLFLY